MTETIKNRKNKKQTSDNESEKVTKATTKAEPAKSVATAPKCEKKCCCHGCIIKCLLVVIMGIVTYYQCAQIKRAEKLLNDLTNDRKEMCQDFKKELSKEQPHYSQADLLPYFAVSFEGGLSYESEELKAFLATKDITQEERYQNEPEEMKRREALYGPYIENGFENDDRFYIKISSPEVGYGLFAKTDIPAGSIIGVYGGQLTRVKSTGITDTDYAWSYQNYVDPETEETFEVCIDGRIYGTWLRFVNHKHDSEANVYGMYVPYKNNWYLLYHARHFIPKDEELFTSYGDFYWDARKDSHHFQAAPEEHYA